MPEAYEIPSEGDARDVWPALRLSNKDLKALDVDRAFPHLFLRSSLFSSRKFSGNAERKTATENDPIELESLSNYSVQQVGGVRLDQGDLDVYVWLLNRAYLSGFAGKGDAALSFTREELLKALGGPRGTNQFRLLHESLMRLGLAVIDYSTPHAAGRMCLISSIEQPKANKRKHEYEVVISGKAGGFFVGSDFKRIPDTERLALKYPSEKYKKKGEEVKKIEHKDYLALWIHAFYSSHNSAPFKYTCDRIKELCDRTDTDEKVWRDKLNKALVKIKEVTKWEKCEVIEDGENQPKILMKKEKPTVIKGNVAGMLRGNAETTGD